MDEPKSQLASESLPRGAFDAPSAEHGEVWMFITNAGVAMRRAPHGEGFVKFEPGAFTL